jgi:hypothetical protein
MDLSHHYSTGTDPTGRGVYFFMYIFINGRLLANISFARMKRLFHFIPYRILQHFLEQSHTKNHPARKWKVKEGGVITGS